MAQIPVAVVQATVATTLAAGLELTRALTTEAAAAGAALVVFPETWLPGYPAWLDVCRDVALWDHAPTKQVLARYRAESVDVSGESGAAIARIAADARVTLVVGVSERVASGPGSGTLFNSLLTYGSAIIGPDGAYIVPPRFDEPAILTATLDTTLLDAERMTLDVAGHYSRGDVFAFEVRPGTSRL